MNSVKKEILDEGPKFTPVRWKPGDTWGAPVQRMKLGTANSKSSSVEQKTTDDTVSPLTTTARDPDPKFHEQKSESRRPEDRAVHTRIVPIKQCQSPIPSSNKAISSTKDVRDISRSHEPEPIVTKPLEPVDFFQACRAKNYMCNLDTFRKENTDAWYGDIYIGSEVFCLQDASGTEYAAYMSLIAFGTEKLAGMSKAPYYPKSRPPLPANPPLGFIRGGGGDGSVSTSAPSPTRGTRSRANAMLDAVPGWIQMDYVGLIWEWFQTLDGGVAKPIFESSAANGKVKHHLTLELSVGRLKSFHAFVHAKSSQMEGQQAAAYYAVKFLLNEHFIEELDEAGHIRRKRKRSLQTPSKSENARNSAPLLQSKHDNIEPANKRSKIEPIIKDAGRQHLSIYPPKPTKSEAQEIPAQNRTSSMVFSQTGTANNSTPQRCDDSQSNSTGKILFQDQKSQQPLEQFEDDEDGETLVSLLATRRASRASEAKQNAVEPCNEESTSESQAPLGQISSQEQTPRPARDPLQTSANRAKLLGLGVPTYYFMPADPVMAPLKFNCSAHLSKYTPKDGVKGGAVVQLKQVQFETGEQAREAIANELSTWLLREGDARKKSLQEQMEALNRGLAD